MPSAPPSSSPCAPLIDPRTTPVVCLPPGWQLLCQQGRVHVRCGPLLWGQVLHDQAQTLESGQLLAGGQDGMPLWLQLRSLEGEPAQLQLLPPAAQPGWVGGWQTARSGLSWLWRLLPAARRAGGTA